MLRERRVGFCNVDQPLIGRSLKPSEKSTAAVGYVRLHGRRCDTWFSDDPAVPSFERYGNIAVARQISMRARCENRIFSRMRPKGLE
jgi:uncharacterized protein YecE (DUF72 family)